MLFTSIREKVRFCFFRHVFERGTFLEHTGILVYRYTWYVAFSAATAAVTRTYFMVLVSSRSPGVLARAFRIYSHQLFDLLCFFLIFSNI